MKKINNQKRIYIWLMRKINHIDTWLFYNTVWASSKNWKAKLDYTISSTLASIFYWLAEKTKK